MTQTEKSVRQSVSIPARVARRVRALAKDRKTSANRVLVDLIEAGLESKEMEKKRKRRPTAVLTNSIGYAA